MNPFYQSQREQITSFPSVASLFPKLFQRMPLWSWRPSMKVFETHFGFGWAGSVSVAPDSPKFRFVRRLCVMFVAVVFKQGGQRLSSSLRLRFYSCLPHPFSSLACRFFTERFQLRDLLAYFAL